MSDLVPLTLADGSTVSLSVVLPASGSDPQAPVVVLAHGAGNDMHTPFLCHVQTGLAARGFPAVRFNFPYAEQGRRAPDRAPVLEACYRDVVTALHADPRLAGRRLVVGGKSMGGRMASHLVAAGLDAAGLLFLGYPLHPAGRPENRRDAHLARIRVPMLFLTGTRDALARLDLLQETVERLRRDDGAHIDLHEIEGGDHSFAVPRSRGRSATEIWDEIVEVSAAWLARLR